MFYLLRGNVLLMLASRYWWFGRRMCRQAFEEEFLRLSRRSSYQVVTPTNSEELFLLEYIALQLKFIKLRFHLNIHYSKTLYASI